jgi:hypothetical protein
VEELIQVLLMFMFMLIHVPSSTRGNRALRGESECLIALSTYLHLPSNLIQALVNALDSSFLSLFRRPIIFTFAVRTPGGWSLWRGCDVM